MSEDELSDLQTRITYQKKRLKSADEHLQRVADKLAATAMIGAYKSQPELFKEHEKALQKHSDLLDELEKLEMELPVE